MGRSDIIDLFGFIAVEDRSSLFAPVDSSGGLVLFQDDMNVGTYIIINKPAQQGRLHHTSKPEIIYGCSSYRRGGPCGHRRWDLAFFNLK